MNLEMLISFTPLSPQRDNCFEVTSAISYFNYPLEGQGVSQFIIY